jgi:hypothetical protein
MKLTDDMYNHRDIKRGLVLVPEQADTFPSVLSTILHGSILT